MFVDDAIITIVLIEALPECKSKAEMKARELFHITNNACININKPFVTETVFGVEWIREYDKANAEHKKEYNKEYKKANAEQIKEYYETNAEQLKEYQKEYYKANAEQIIEQQKKYNKANVKHKKAYDKEYRAKKKAQKLITETLVV